MRSRSRCFRNGPNFTEQQTRGPANYTLSMYSRLAVERKSKGTGMIFSQDYSRV
jgi:hypothetical protein